MLPTGLDNEKEKKNWNEANDSKMPEKFRFTFLKSGFCYSLFHFVWKLGEIIMDSDILNLTQLYCSCHVFLSSAGRTIVTKNTKRSKWGGLPELNRTGWHLQCGRPSRVVSSTSYTGGRGHLEVWKQGTGEGKHVKEADGAEWGKQDDGFIQDRHSRRIQNSLKRTILTSML